MNFTSKSASCTSKSLSCGACGQFWHHSFLLRLNFLIKLLKSIKMYTYRKKAPPLNWSGGSERVQLQQSHPPLHAQYESQPTSSQSSTRAGGGCKEAGQLPSLLQQYQILPPSVLQTPSQPLVPHR